MSSPVVHSGSCLCGAVSIEASGEPRWVSHCHCPSCQKAVGAAFATYAGFSDAAVRLSGDTIRTYRSSPGVSRKFCNACGSAISFSGEAWPGEIHLHLVLLDGADTFKPQDHSYVRAKRPWIQLSDNLPQQEKLSKDRS